MNNITYAQIIGGDIEICRDLCNELMAFQKEKAEIAKEAFDMMSFETRMKKSFENAFRTHVVVALDNGVPVGYVFSTIDIVPPEARSSAPPWAPKGDDIIGFFPNWLNLPKKVGTLSNLYVRPEYRGTGMGNRLYTFAVEWLESFDDVDISFVYISNGNNKAEKFYIDHGFTYSHDVYGGFITAAYKGKTRPMYLM